MHINSMVKTKHTGPSKNTIKFFLTKEYVAGYFAVVSTYMEVVINAVAGKLCLAVGCGGVDEPDV